MCVCVFSCVYERERERVGGGERGKSQFGAGTGGPRSTGNSRTPVSFANFAHLELVQKVRHKWRVSVMLNYVSTTAL